MDQISNLPAPILHNILSRLPEKDVARTSVLSKSWKQTLSTFPILVFNEFRYAKQDEAGSPHAHQRNVYKWKRINFLNSVGNKLEKFCDDKLCVKQLKLVVRSREPHNLYTRIDHWLKLATECGIEELDLFLENCYHGEPGDCYCMSESILKAKSLVKLGLKEKMIKLDKVFLNHPIQFTLLQVLSLKEVCFENEQVFQNLISSCLSIECMNLINCYGLRYLTIDGLPKLKQLRIENPNGKVVVDAPNLESLYCCALYIDMPNMVYKCTNLRVLCLYRGKDSRLTVTNLWLIQLFQKLPFIESLELGFFFMSHNIEISNLQLKVLKLIECYWVETLIIDGPNLRMFDFSSSSLSMPDITFLNHSSQLKAKACFHLSSSGCFVKLREFLHKLEPRNVLSSLTLDISQEPGIDLNTNALPDVLVPPPSVKHLELKLSFGCDSFGFHAIAGLLWCCLPTNISIKLRDFSHTCGSSGIRFAELLAKKVMTREDCCCSRRTIKCWLRLCNCSKIKFWWHGLKDVKVTGSLWNNGNFVCCETLLDALPTLPFDETVNFIFEW